MSLVLTNVGDLSLLTQIVAFWNGAGDVIIHLVKADWTPSETTVESDMTEATFAGYSEQTATGWTAPTTVSSKAKTVADVLIFTRSTTGTAQTIYGYWAEPSDSPGDVLWSEKFSSPITLTNAGEGIALTPTFTVNKE